MSARSDSAVHPDERVGQLTRDLAEAVEQQLATSQVLEAIGRSDFELGPVLETVVRHAVRLCDADAGFIHRLDGDRYRLAYMQGGSQAYHDYVAANPILPGPGNLVGRVALGRRTVQIRDVLDDPDYDWHIGRELGGFRTMLGVPVLAGEGQVLGVLSLWRATVEPFDERTIRLMTTFAAQAAIAVQNVELFHELNHSVEELRALGEISQAVSSTLDLDEVLTTIVIRAVELSGTEGGSIFEFDAGSGLFTVRTCVGTSDELVQDLRQTRIHLDETFVGRAAAGGQPLQAPDLQSEARDPHIERLRDAGWRSMLAVPLLREHEIIGALIVRRTVPGPFPQRTVDVMETLASQSAVAIHNARVFQELDVKTKQLEVASRHKSEFLASMSHELRTPLNAVIGFSDVLLERMFGDLNERQEEYIADIRDSGAHLLELINEILDLSKVEAGRMELERANVSIPQVLDHALAMVRERAGRRRIAVELEISPDVGRVWADELKLKQVMLNLLTNAVKFTEPGGHIFVDARIAEDNLEVTVRDTGIGIADDDQERIFEAFQRGGRNARTSTEGTGLGLTLSKRIVELHGGRMWMESRLREGSTFGFSIPVVRPLEAPPDVATPMATGTNVYDADRRTVVVIDDDPLDLDLLEAMLAPAGYAVVRAPSGEDGVRLVCQERPGVVLLDLVMPDMDGFEVIERLRSMHATSDVPIVVLTSKELSRRDRERLSGRIDYLAQKGTLTRAALLDLVARLGEPRVPNEPEDAP